MSFSGSISRLHTTEIGQSEAKLKEKAGSSHNQSPVQLKILSSTLTLTEIVQNNFILNMTPENIPELAQSHTVYASTPEETTRSCTASGTWAEKTRSMHT